MNRKKLKVGAVGILLLGAVTILIIQETRLRRLGADNARLSAQSAETPALPQGVDQAPKDQMDRLELERLRSMETQLQSELAALRARISNANRIESDNAQLKGELERQTAHLRSVLDGRFAADMAMLKEKAGQIFYGQMPGVTRNLSLTRHQQVAIRSLLQSRVDFLSNFYEMGADGEPVLRRLSPENERQLAAIKAGSFAGSDIDTQVRSLLSPEQQAVYETLQKEEGAERKGKKAWLVVPGRGLIEKDED